METEMVLGYKKFTSEMIEKKQLHNFHLALSRESNQFYVMDLIKRDAAFFTDLLQQNGVIMICGSLAMQKDVESGKIKKWYVPDEIIFVTAIPKTSVGKIDKKKIRKDLSENNSAS